jgi:pimeloyl-ACP methyl ester carboxylesterase
MSSGQTSSELLYFTERGSGPPLLLVHGLMVTGEMFEPVTDHFATRHRVIVPDLRGHGRSRGLPPPYTAARLASDLAHLLDHLGVDSTAVLGYSQGGAIQRHTSGVATTADHLNWMQIAVGTTLTDGPPHRSQRAGLPLKQGSRPEDGS